MSLPYMPLYVGDYLADTGHLSAAENGAYLLLIMYYWRNGGLPSDGEMLRRISRMTHREWNRSRATVMAFFSSDGKHKRVDEELARVNHKSDVLRANALKSHEARRANEEQKHLQPDCIPESESESYKDSIDANASITILQDERDKKKKAEERENLRELGERWNRIASELGLPIIEEIKPGSKRERSALARIRDGCDFERVFVKIRGSPFLRGDRGSTPASFNWIINPENYQKIIEGNYDEVRQAYRR